MALSNLIPFRKNRSEASGLPASRQESPFFRLQEEMNQLFDDFLPTRFRRMGDVMTSPRDWDFMPDVDVKETKRDYLVSVELPGVDEKDLDVRLDGNTLTIRGEKREEKTDKDGGRLHSECHYGAFMRSIPLTTEVDGTKVDATYKKGVLKVKLPKAKPDTGCEGRIEVKAG